MGCHSIGSAYISQPFDADFSGATPPELTLGLDQGKVRGEDGAGIPTTGMPDGWDLGKDSRGMGMGIGMGMGMGTAPDGQRRG